MSEQSDPNVTGSALPTIESPSLQASLSAGGLLRQAREAAGLHIGELAVSLKVPVKKLEALEADKYDLLLDTVFVRALASSVCRTLKMDASLVLRLLPQINSPKLPQEGLGTNASFRAQGGGQRSSIWAQISRPAVLAGLILVLGALVLIFLPAAKSGWNDITAESSTNAAKPAVGAMLLSTSFAEVVGPDAGKPVAADKTSRSSVIPIAALPAEMPTSAVDILAPPSAAAGVASWASAATQTSGILVFNAKGNSWVEVTDSKGQVVLRRTLNAGESASVSGALPLAAVVGRADSIQVQVRGKAFDLNGFAKDNVARFEVK